MGAIASQNDCLLNRLLRRRSKKTSNIRVTGLCQGNSPMTGEFPAQMASNAKNVTIWSRHHDLGNFARYYFIPSTAKEIPLCLHINLVWICPRTMLCEFIILGFFRHCTELASLLCFKLYSMQMSSKYIVLLWIMHVQRRRWWKVNEEMLP